MSIRVRKRSFRLIETADDLRRTLTPSQFAPDSDNKWLATSGRRTFMVINRGCHRPFNVILFTPGGLPLFFTIDDLHPQRLP